MLDAVINGIFIFLLIVVILFAVFIFFSCTETYEAISNHKKLKKAAKIRNLLRETFSEPDQYATQKYVDGAKNELEYRLSEVKGFLLQETERQKMNLSIVNSKLDVALEELKKKGKKRGK